MDKIVYTHSEESYVSRNIYRKSREVRHEPSAEYKAPDDDIMEDVYAAESEHGEFKWSVTARREGFETYAEIEDVEIIQSPRDCEFEDPSFSIKQM
nr:hypothetical protein [Xanthomonas campestris]MDM7702373.1 hypothetical protein [Xanthomonas campestris pv. campestris]